jgi:hypothetical protein
MTTRTAPALPNAPAPKDADEAIVERLLTFSYRGWQFHCGAQRGDRQTYWPVVFCCAGDSDEEAFRLPADTDNVAYGSEAEALRHAEQQAIRWVHDRTGDGQGQF